MKNRRIQILFLTAVMLCSACSEKFPFSNLQGKWYPLDSQGMIVHYIEFSHGYLTTYSSDWSHPVSDGTIFNCFEYDFVPYFREAYSVIDGCLISGHHNYGPVSVDGTLLRIGDKSYRRLEKMEDSSYSHISVLENSIVCPHGGGQIKIITKLVNPIVGYDKVKVSYCPRWVFGVITEKDWVQFSVGGLTGDTARRDSLVLSYPFSEDAVVYLEQK